MEELLKSGSTAFGQGEFEKALTAYSAAIDLDPKCVRAYSNRSATFAQLKKYDKALEDAEKCLELDKSFIKGYGRKGAALQGLNRYEEARHAYSNGLLLEPSNANYKQAVSELVQLVKDGKGIASEETRKDYYLNQSLNKGKEAMTHGRFAEAVRHYTKALSLCGQDVKHTILCNRSAAHFKAGDMEESLSDADSALKVSPSHGRAHLRRAYALHKMNKVPAAKEALAKALEITPKCEKSLELKRSIEEEEEKRKAVEEVPAPVEPKVVPPGPAAAGVGSAVHRNSYSYCDFCNKYGHMRKDCPRRKR